MKKILLICLSLLLCGCSSNDSNGINLLPSVDQQKAYELIYEGIKNKENAVNLKGCKLESEEIFDIATQVSDDHPELFYFSGDTSYRYMDYFVYKEGTLDLKYTYSLEEIESYETTLNSIKESYLSEIQGMSQWEVLEYTYNYLMDLITYDYDTLERVPSVVDEPDAYGLVGSLINHYCVCAGYARAFQYFIQAAGYECIYVKGTLEENSHGWDAVKIDGQYYHFDLTSDDQDDKITYPVYFYQFFGLTTEQIRKTHIIDTALPDSNDLSQNYHVHYGHYIHSMDELNNVLEAQRNYPAIYIECASEELMNQVLDDLLNNVRIRDYTNAYSLRYVTCPNINLIVFYSA